MEMAKNGLFPANKVGIELFEEMRASRPFITSPYTDVQTGGLCITASKAVIRDGEVIGVAAADILIDQLNTIVADTDVGEGSYAFLTDAGGEVYIHPNESYAPDADDIFPLLGEVDGGLYGEVWAAGAEDDANFRARDADGSAYYSNLT